MMQEMATLSTVIHAFRESSLRKRLMFELDKKAMTRSELVEKLSKPRTTIYDNLRSLEKRDIVKREKRRNGKRGRPKTVWKLTNEAKYGIRVLCKEEDNEE